ncbi:MAG: serine hydroxymethyltransferase, partial [Clostridia bacterium]|nr:serine hydroxymethyltransferase [Clostridia bacterium]
SHLMLLDLTSNHITGKELEALLDEAHITVNKNAIPFDTEKPFVTSGVRIGTPSVTQRGMKEADCEYIADLITDVIKHRAEAVERVKAAVIALCEKYPIYDGDVL